MPRHNLYIVLGVPPDATADMIRSAYRRLAKVYHPDRVGPSGASRFHAVAEAYRVLSDPERRDAYNAALARRPVEERYRVDPVGRWGPGGFEPSEAEPIAIRRNLHAGHPSLEDDFVDWMMRYFSERHIPKSGRRREVDLDVILSPDEALVGGILPIEIPAFSICPACGGSGRDVFSFCRACSGVGVREGRRTARLHIPAMVPDGATWEVSVPEGGLDLRVRIRIDPFGG